MTSYLLTYDLFRPGQNYPALITALTNAGAVRILQSTWVLRSQGTSGSLRDHFRQYMDANDSIFVCELNTNWAAFWKFNSESLRVLPP